MKLGDIIILSYYITGVNCGTLPSPYNGQASLQGSSFHFSCVNGFALIGDSVRHCQTNGDWSGTQPRCVGKTIISVLYVE